MIRPVFRGAFIAVVISSFLFFILGISGDLHENIFTGAVVGVEEFTSYAFGIFLLGLVLSAVYLRFRKR